MKGSWDGDRDPLAAIQRGDPGPFEEFVRLEAPTFIGFFERLGADRAQAEDLAQEVFLRLYRTSGSYQPRGAFEAWSLRIARNSWIDFGRRRALRPAPAAGGDDEPEPAPAADPAPHASAELAEEAQRARAALAELTPGQRAVFELAVLQELPYPEIARLLEIPVGTVKSRVFHAVRRLRALLEPAPAPQPEPHATPGREGERG